MYIPLTFEGALQSCLYASGGFEQGFFISGSQQYAFHVFNETGSHNFEVLAGTLNNVKIAVVGGGGGGSDTFPAAGGGGGGGVIVQDNVILYAGTYSINVGRGGLPLDPGQGTSIAGANLSLSVGGGNPGFGNVGGNSGTPNSFLGAAGTSAQGGGGGGAAGNAYVNGNALFNEGGPGITSSFGGDTGGMPFPFSYGNTKYLGAGGNGDQSGVSDPFSLYGRGGVGTTSGPGQAGRDGVVIIQYPINDYCKNFFNETGSCGCVEHVFNITDGLNFYPDITGSYQYTPCGTNTFASGTLEAYWPVTVCAASNSWYWYEWTGSIPNIVSASFGGFVNGAASQCFSASYGVQTCVTQSFEPTCNSSIYTFLAGTGSATPQTLFWIPKNESNFSYETLTNNYVTYKCVSTGSVGSIGDYPYGISGIGSIIFQSASCLYTDFTASWSGVGASTSFASITFRQCNGTITTLSVNRGATSGTTIRYIAGMCIDQTYPVTTTRSGLPVPAMTVNTGSSCLGNYIDTGSCGCP
jgi:hypothetical protein